MKTKKQVAHIYRWQESAIHGIRGAKAVCGFVADETKEMYKAPEKAERCQKCERAGKPSKRK